MNVPLLLALLPFVGLSGHPATWSFSATALGNKQHRVDLTVTLEEGWHVYALELPSDEGPLPTVIRVEQSSAFELADSAGEPEPKEEYDPNFGVVVRHHSGVVTFSVTVEALTDKVFEVQGEVEYMLCNDRTCLPPVAVPFKVPVGTSPKK